MAACEEDVQRDPESLLTWGEPPDSGQRVNTAIQEHGEAGSYQCIFFLFLNFFYSLYLD